MGSRGSVQRRRPNPDRKPEPRPVTVIAKVPMFFDVGPITVPSNGSVKVFEQRFPSSGNITKASLRMRNMPENSFAIVELSLDGELVAAIPWDDKKEIIRIPDKLPIDDTVTVRINVRRANQREAVSASADIAYLFQETLRATVPV